MNYNTHQLQFVPDPEGVGTAFFTENGLWEITRAFLTTPNLTVRGETMASISVTIFSTCDVLHTTILRF